MKRFTQAIEIEPEARRRQSPPEPTQKLVVASPGPNRITSTWGVRVKNRPSVIRETANLSEICRQVTSKAARGGRIK
jgi:hypothetical protein